MLRSNSDEFANDFAEFVIKDLQSACNRLKPIANRPVAGNSNKFHMARTHSVHNQRDLGFPSLMRFHK